MKTKLLKILCLFVFALLLGGITPSTRGLAAHETHSAIDDDNTFSVYYFRVNDRYLTQDTTAAFELGESLDIRVEIIIWEDMDWIDTYVMLPGTTEIDFYSDYDLSGSVAYEFRYNIDIPLTLEPGPRSLLYNVFPSLGDDRYYAFPLYLYLPDQVILERVDVDTPVYANANLRYTPKIVNFSTNSKTIKLTSSIPALGLTKTENVYMSADSTHTEAHTLFIPDSVESGSYDFKVEIEYEREGELETDTIIQSVTILNDGPQVPVLAVNPTSLDFGYYQDQHTFEISNNGEGSLYWTLTEEAGWLQLDSASGSTGGDGSYSGVDGETVTVTVDRSGLPDGAYQTDIQVVSNGGSQNLSVFMDQGHPPAYLTLFMDSHQDNAERLAGKARIQNTDPENSQDYDIEFRLETSQGGFLQSSQSTIQDVAAGGYRYVDFDFGYQPVGDYLVMAEITYPGQTDVIDAATGSVTVVSQAVERALFSGQYLSLATNAVLRTNADKAAERLADGWDSAQEGALSILLDLFNDEIVKWLGKNPDLSYEDVTSVEKSTEQIFNYISSFSYNPDPEAFIDQKMGPHYDRVQGNLAAYNQEMKGAVFTWEPQYEELTNRWVQVIQNKPDNIQLMFPAIVQPIPMFEVVPYSQVFARYDLYRAVIEAIADATELLTVLALIVVVTILIVATAGGASITLPALLTTGLSSLNKISTAANLARIASLALALTIVILTVSTVSAEIVDTQQEALDDLAGTIQGASGDADLAADLTARVDGNRVVLLSEIANPGPGQVAPLAHTYLLDTAGKLVDILRDHAAIPAGGSRQQAYELALPPGNYQAVTVLHSADQLAVTSSQMVPFEVSPAAVSLAIGLDHYQIEPGERVQASFVVNNWGDTAVDDLELFATFGLKSEVWHLGLAPGATETITYEFIAQGDGLLRAVLLDAWGVIAKQDTGLATLDAGPLVLNASPSRVYEQGEAIIEPLTVRNLGPAPETVEISWTTFDATTQQVRYQGSDSQTFSPSWFYTLFANWLQTPTPGDYITQVAINNQVYQLYTYSVRAENSLFANLLPDEDAHQTGISLPVQIEIKDAAFNLVDPELVSVEVLTPQGALILPGPAGRVSTGLYQTSFVPPVPGSYEVRTRVEHANQFVVQDLAVYEVESQSILQPQISGVIAYGQPASVTVVVTNEYDQPQAGASLSLYGTGVVLYGLTDVAGQCSFEFTPAADTLTLTVEKSGYGQAVQTITPRAVEDTLAPALVMALSGETNENPYTLNGRTEPGAQLLINGLSVAVDAGGVYTETLSLAPGGNTITVTARDVDDNQQQVSGEIILDEGPPALLVATPLDQAYVPGVSVRVAGTAEPGATLLVNGQYVPLQEDGGFQFWEVLTGLETIITIQAFDPAGNPTTVTRTVVGGNRIYMPVVLRE